MTPSNLDSNSDLQSQPPSSDDALPVPPFDTHESKASDDDADNAIMSRNIHHQDNIGQLPPHSFYIQIDSQPQSSENHPRVQHPDTSGSNHVLEASDDDVDNPIMSRFRSQELGKTVLGFIVPLTSGLLLYRYKELTHLEAELTTVALALGFAATWSGIMLGGMYRRVASAMESFGVALVFITFYVLLGSLLPSDLQRISWLFCAFSCLPLVLSHLPLKPRSPPST